MACVAGVLRFRWFDPRYPYSYDNGDAMLHVMVIKAITEHGWYQHIDRLGAPDGLRLEDFPMCDNLCCAVIRFLALFTSNPFLIQNLVFVGFFPVTAVVACWTLRRFGLSAGSAMLGGILYALLPYHFLRGTWHLFLTAYFLVPPACLVAWWAMQGMLLEPRDDVESSPEERARRFRLYGSVVICALMGCNAVYYPFFSCIMLAVAGIYALTLRRDVRHGALAWGLAALIGVVVVANLLPTILYVRQHGPSLAGLRTPGEAEAYGLKLVQLFLPITHHRLPVLAALKDRYNADAPLVNENDLASLGLVGSAGLLLLLGWALFAPKGAADALPRRDPREPLRLGPVLGPMSVLNVVAILFGTIGGFSSLFALLVSPQVRAYDRISVFIAFFALLTVGAMLDVLVLLWLRSPAGRALAFALVLALTGFGVWDQTTDALIEDYYTARHQCIDDARYFAKIEAILPAGAMVFQLPVTKFPEAGAINRLGDYFHARAYVQTRTLRWSYGAIEGRKDDRWDEVVAPYPPELMLQSMVAAGFRGLYLDGRGYADKGVSEIAAFSSALDGAAPLLSKDRLTAFFDLGPHAEALLKGANASRRDALLHPLLVDWKADFYGLEKNDVENWRWCGHQGDIVLQNESPTVHKTVRVAMVCRTATPGLFDLRVGGDVMHQDMKISEREGELSATIDVPPGQHVIHFDCDAPPGIAPQDPRQMVWQTNNAVVEDITGK